MNKIIAGTDLAEGRGNNGIETVFKNCVPFTYCISKLNNTQIDNANGINVGRPMYSLIKLSIIIQKHQEVSLWRCYRDEPSLIDAGALDNFPGNSALFKCK